MSWVAGRAIDGTRGEISAALRTVRTRRRHTVACISGHSESEHPAAEPLSDGDGTAATAAQQSTANRDGGQSACEVSAAWLGVLAVGVPPLRLTRRWGGRTVATDGGRFSFPEGVRRRRQAFSVRAMIAGRSCARVFPALPIQHVLLQQGVAGIHRGVDAAGADLPSSRSGRCSSGGGRRGSSRTGCRRRSAPRCPSAHGR
jgi:hypothetical protein